MGLIVKRSFRENVPGPWFFSILLMLFVGSGCYAQDEAEIGQATLVDVLAKPTAYVGKRISVMGYLAEYANLGLFLSREHASARDYLSSIVIADYDDRAIQRSGCMDRMVEISGTLKQYSRSEFVLIDVTTISLVSTNEPCWVRVEDGQ